MPSRRPVAPPSSPDDFRAHLELLDLAMLKPHPRNDGRHPPAELEHLKQSLTEHGFDKNIIVANDGTILTGHGVVEAALALGYTHLYGQRKPYGPDDPLAYKRLIGDNHIARLREQDDMVLAGLLQDLAADDPLSLLGTGFDTDALAVLMQSQGAVPEAQPPEDFPSYDEDIATEYCCPKCGYQWSGAPRQ